MIKCDHSLNEIIVRNNGASLGYPMLASSQVRERKSYSSNDTK